MIIDHAEYTGPTRQHEFSIRVLAIYQILLGWKTYKYYNETDELPNPRPTQPKEKKKIKSGNSGHFFLTANIFLVGRDWFYIGNRLREK